MSQQEIIPANNNQLAGVSQGDQFFSQTKTLSGYVNAGSVAIEQERAVAEAKGQMALAKMFPRNVDAAYSELMNVCKLQAMANVAFYTVPQGGQKVTGPSIKLIEQVASSLGNFEWGHRELSRVEASGGSFGRSEIEVFAWDKEKNNRSSRQITVLHVMDTKDGPRKLRDQRDIDNKIANVASKQMRGRLQALMPKWLIESAIEECRKTLSGNNSEPISARIRKMIDAFAGYGVSVAHLEAYLGHKLDETLSDELIDLVGVYNALREGASASEFFTIEKAEKVAEVDAASAIKAAATAAPPATTAAPQVKTDTAPSAVKPTQTTVAKNSKPVETESKVDAGSKAGADTVTPSDDDEAF